MPVEILNEPSILELDIMGIETRQPSWMNPITVYLKGKVPQNRAEARKLRHQAAHYILIDGQLYKRGYSLPLLMCLDSREADYVMREVHEGVCGNHSGGRSMAAKIIRQGYYWPTLSQDTKNFAKKCDKCQRFANISRQPPELLMPVTSL